MGKCYIFSVRAWFDVIRGINVVTEGNAQNSADVHWRCWLKDLEYIPKVLT
jgi:hypothetical protein